MGPNFFTGFMRRTKELLVNKSYVHTELTDRNSKESMEYMNI